MSRGSQVAIGALTVLSGCTAQEFCSADFVCIGASYCCGYNVCCMDVHKIWWFWTIWVIVFVCIIVFAIVCARRRRRMREEMLEMRSHLHQPYPPSTYFRPAYPARQCVPTSTGTVPTVDTSGLGFNGGYGGSYGAPLPYAGYAPPAGYALAPPAQAQYRPQVFEPAAFGRQPAAVGAVQAPDAPPIVGPPSYDAILAAERRPEQPGVFGSYGESAGPAVK